MASKRQQIVDALATKLASVSGMGGRVHCRPTRALTVADLPCIVFADTEATAEMEIIGTRTHRLQVDIDAVTTTKTSAAAARNLLSDLCATLFGDQSLGGLAESIELNSHNIHVEQDGDMLSAARASVTIHYRTAPGAI